MVVKVTMVSSVMVMVIITIIITIVTSSSSSSLSSACVQIACADPATCTAKKPAVMSVWPSDIVSLVLSLRHVDVELAVVDIRTKRPIFLISMPYAMMRKIMCGLRVAWSVERVVCLVP